jgi:hypothetical protein
MALIVDGLQKSGPKLKKGVENRANSRTGWAACQRQTGQNKYSMVGAVPAQKREREVYACAHGTHSPI